MSFTVVNFYGLLILARGCVFGLATAVIYYINSEQGTITRLVEACVITVAGAICYFIAFWITDWITIAGLDTELIAAPIGAIIGGFVATWGFVSILQAITNKYSTVRVKFGLYGGLFGALLIDSIVYVLSSAIATTSDVDPRVLFLGGCIFFVGWQTTMLLIISGPLLKTTGDQITTPTAVAGPVNDAAPR